MKYLAGLIILGTLFFTSCEKDQYAYKKFIDGKEIVYAGLAEQLLARSGNLRVQLEWQASIDPTVVTYTAYWNNGKDSASVPATAAGADGIFRYVISGLPEYTQSFSMTTVNDRGYRSIGQTVNGIRVFGPFYNAALVNQRFNNSKVFGTDSVRLYFFRADSTKVYSKLWYYKNDGNTDSVLFKQDSVTISSFKPGTRAAIRSYYLPMRNAIDTFKTLQADSLQAF